MGYAIFLATLLNSTPKERNTEPIGCHKKFSFLLELSLSAVREALGLRSISPTFVWLGSYIIGMTFKSSHWSLMLWIVERSLFLVLTYKYWLIRGLPCSIPGMSQKLLVGGRTMLAILSWVCRRTLHNSVESMALEFVQHAWHSLP